MKPLIITCIAMLTMGSCGSTQHQKPMFDTNPPFEVLGVSATPWAAGVRGGGSGVNVELRLNRPYHELLFVYYQGQKADINYDDADVENAIYRAYIKTQGNTSRELILHQDPKKEYGNTPPLFKLKYDDLAIVYTKKKKTYYSIVSRVVRKPSINYM